MHVGCGLASEWKRYGNRGNTIEIDQESCGTFGAVSLSLSLSVRVSRSFLIQMRPARAICIYVNISTDRDSSTENRGEAGTLVEENWIQLKKKIKFVIKSK